MSSCKGCHKPITSAQRRNMVTVKNLAGKIIGAAHGKCKRIADRRAVHADQAAAGHAVAGHDAPSAYEAHQKFSGQRVITDEDFLAARERQEAIAKDRAAGLDERREDNWREDVTDIDALESTDELLELEGL